MFYLEHSHIVEMIAEGTLEPASYALLDAANRAADAVPWNRVGTRINWERLGTKVDLDIDDPISSLERTVLGRCPKLLFMFNRESGVIGVTTAIWSRLDEIAWRAPGQRHVFGVAEDGSLNPGAMGMFGETGCLLTTVTNDATHVGVA